MKRLCRFILSLSLACAVILPCSYVLYERDVLADEDVAGPVSGEGEGEGAEDLFDPERPLTDELMKARVEALRQQFPAGRYWNSKGIEGTNIEGTTDIPCIYYSHKDNEIIFNGKKYYQCWGFCMLLSERIYGTNFMDRGWYDANVAHPDETIAPGDVIRYGYDGRIVGHTVMVLGISGDTVRIVDCNHDDTCVIRWDAKLSLRNDIMRGTISGVVRENVINQISKPTEELSYLPDGYCGEDARYTIDSNGVLTITGTGLIDNRIFEGDTSITKVVIGEGITGTGYRTFAGCTGLQEAVLPEGFEIIYKESFDGCTSLVSFDLPGSVSVIGENAFRGCPGICGSFTTYVIEDGILTVTGNGSIDSGAFKGNTTITKAVIGDGIEVIGSGAFEGCTSLSEVVLPAGIIRIGSGAFSGCNSLDKINIPSSLEYIADAFSGCPLGTVTLSEGVTACPDLSAESSGYCGADAVWSLSGTIVSISGTGSLYDESFDSTTGKPTSPWFYKKKPSAFRIGEGITSLGEYCFCYQEASGVTASLPKSLETIGDHCFRNVTVSIPADGSLRKIGAYGISGSQINGKVVLPEGLEEIGEGAFSRCTNMSAVNIPSSVVKVGKDAFSGDDSLADIYCFPSPDDLVWEAAAIYNYPRFHVYSEYYDSYKDELKGLYIRLTGDLGFVSGNSHLAGYSVSLDGDIGINFYMTLSDEVAGSETAYMEFNTYFDGGITTTEVPVKDAKVVYDDQTGQTYYVFKKRVAAKNMTDDIDARLIDGDNKSENYRVTVKGYADYLLAHREENPEYKRAAPLVIAMLNYGTYAQKMLLNTPWYGKFPNDSLTSEETRIRYWKEPYDPGYTVELTGDVVFEGATLSLKSETTLSLYFTCPGKLKFTCPEGKTVERHVVRDDDGNVFQVARIRGINASELWNGLYTVEVEGYGYVVYSPMRYIYSMYNDPVKGDDYYELMRSLSNYAYQAYLYFTGD